MDVYWLEQNMTDVPRTQDWLSLWEANHARSLRFPKRLSDWLLGRWTAKNAVSVFFGIPSQPHALSDIEIRPSPSGAPQVFLRGALSGVEISLSHRAGVAACVLAPSGVPLGCDLETIEAHGDTFSADYFTDEEQALVTQASTEAEGMRALTLLWSAKESALKALGEGLRVDTRRVVVSLPGLDKNQDKNERTSTLNFSACAPAFSRHVGWSPLRVHYAGQQIFHGWWNQTGPLLRTVLAIPAPNPPILLQQTSPNRALVASEPAQSARG